MTYERRQKYSKNIKLILIKMYVEKLDYVQQLHLRLHLQQQQQQQQHSLSIVCEKKISV